MLMSAWSVTEVLAATLQSDTFWEDEEGFRLSLALLWYTLSWYNPVFVVGETKGKNTWITGLSPVPRGHLFYLPWQGSAPAIHLTLFPSYIYYGMEAHLSPEDARFGLDIL